MYFPPRSPFEQEYIDHIISTIDNVLTKHPNAGIFLMGDMNDLNTESILNNDNFHQVVNMPTRDNNILDKIISNCDKFFLPVTVMSPLGKSDHNCVLLRPIDSFVRSKKKIKVKVTRPLPDSGLRLFGQWITQYTWDDMLQLQDPSEKCSLFIQTTLSKLDEVVPTKEIKIKDNDKPWMTPQIKAVIIERERAFVKKNKPLWRNLRNKVNKLIISAKNRYYNTRVSHLKSTNPADWYKQIKIITKRNNTSPEIAVPGVELNDNDYCDKTADAINKHFISIASELAPLDRSCLPAFLPSPCVCPEVQPYQVHTMLKKIKCNKAGVTDDLPPRVIREFACELSHPLANILNMSFQQGLVPRQWKTSQVVPIPKSQPPPIRELRPISLTSQFAKIAESFITKWLLEDISEYIDIHQYGNRPGLSTTHYLVRLLHCVFENCEKSKSVSTIACTDFSKAFDRLDHNILIRKLIEYNVRPCIIEWIISFLDNRLQSVKYHGVLSPYITNHAGVPQGTKLGPILFLIMFNDACQMNFYHILNMSMTLP